MNNLPVLTSAPQAAVKPAQPTQTAKPAQAAQAAKPAQTAAEEGAAQGKSFGNVLARQVADAEVSDDTLPAKKLSAQSADEVVAKIKADEAIAPALPGDAAANLPTDMLAALIPQGMAIAASSASNSELTDLSKQTAQAAAEAEVTGLPAQTALPSILDKADPGASKSATASAAKGAAAASDALVDVKKNDAFTSMLATMNATTASKSFATDEKSAALAASSQPNAAALASMQATATPLTPVNVFPTQVTINTPVTHDKWGDEFNQKITWLANSKEQIAELHLNPPQLGPMDVVLKVSGDQATALFTSPHAAVREAIEQALPKLREMLADSGIMLGNATVNDQAPRNRHDGFDNKSQNSRSSIGGIADAGAASNMSARVSPISRHNGIVDTFA